MKRKMENNQQIEVLEDREVDVKARQEPIRERYRSQADEAIVYDWARTVPTQLDPFHGRVDLGESSGGARIPGNHGSEEREGKHYGLEYPVGIHRAIGGDHDLPNPGNLLAAALATCFDTTIRMIADRLRVGIQSLQVEVSTMADVRGTLRVDPEVPVQFQEMHMNVRLQVEEGSKPSHVEKLLAAAEFSCVNLRTLINGVPVQIDYQTSTSEQN